MTPPVGHCFFGKKLEPEKFVNEEVGNKTPLPAPYLKVTVMTVCSIFIEKRLSERFKRTNQSDSTNRIDSAAFSCLEDGNGLPYRFL